MTKQEKRRDKSVRELTDAELDKVTGGEGAYNQGSHKVLPTGEKKKNPSLPKH